MPRHASKPLGERSDQAARRTAAVTFDYLGLALRAAAVTCTVLVAEWGGIRNALGLLGTAEQADWHSASSRAPRALSPLETSGGGPFNHHRYARRWCRSERFVRQPSWWSATRRR